MPPLLFWPLVRPCRSVVAHAFVLYSASNGAILRTAQVCNTVLLAQTPPATRDMNELSDHTRR
jgi:uncharacterized membrane protein